MSISLNDVVSGRALALTEARGADNWRAAWLRRAAAGVRRLFGRAAASPVFRVPRGGISEGGIEPALRVVPIDRGRVPFNR